MVLKFMILRKKCFCYNSLLCVPTSGFMNMHNLKILWLSSVSWYLKCRNVEFSWKAQYFVGYPYENGSVRGTNFIKMEM